MDRAVGSAAHFEWYLLSGAALTREFKRQLDCASTQNDRARLTDCLASEYLDGGNTDLALAALDDVGWIVEVELRAPLLALRGVLDAMTGDSGLDHIEQALGALSQISEQAAAIVLQRAGLAMFLCGSALSAEEHSLNALMLARKLGLRSVASKAAGVLRDVYYHLILDSAQAKYYAECAVSEAGAAGDALRLRATVIAQFGFAVAIGEWDWAERSHLSLCQDGSRGLPASEFLFHVSEALLQARADDFSTMLGRLDAIVGPQPRTCTSSLVRAWRALALAGVGLDREGRGEARSAFALADTNGVSQDERLDFAAWKQLAGVLAAFASMLLGDVSRYGRALDARSKRHGSVGVLARALVLEFRGCGNDLGNPNLQLVRGYVEVAQRIMACRARRRADVPFLLRLLNETDLQILHLLSMGKSNATIAEERNVSRNAIEKHLVKTYRKLKVHTRAQAVAALAQAVAR